MIERALRYVIFTVVAAAMIACLSRLGVLDGAAMPWRSGLTGVMSLWGAAGAMVVASMAALTLSELIGTLLESTRTASRTAIAFAALAGRH
ncbi:hypothetical protein SAMN05519104_2289 [Rhizobiales bacterium GAS188]|nr:hypothetical protein SAMN05519104_2289 [Rhizobiales bacterium GAS188]